MADFLLEIGLEEIPARMIEGAEEELHRRLGEVLTRESLTDKIEIEKFSTPRRLGLLARGVREAQADAEETLKGPSVQVAFKDGQPQMAALKFAEKAGVDVTKLERIKDAKGEYISARVTKKGRTADQILAEALPKEINALYWAKNMYWRAGKPERFVRPVRWMVALLGGRVVPVEFGGVRAGKTSRGHRLQSPVAGRQSSEVEIREPQTYASTLMDVGVVARREERVEIIRKALDKATRTVPGARWREDASLLATVVDLTEFPGVILGNFDPEFLALPEEVLVTVMRDHQKYFAVEDKNGKLAPHFLAAMNTGDDPQGIIRHGHERVLRARFNDARFFWDTDQKHPLRERVEWLKNVTFQKDLGSYYDKTIRVQKLASQICALLNDQSPVAGRHSTAKTVRDGIVHKAALLAKTDLTTELVKEFTELQGVVGGLYAKAQELDPAIGDAIYDQYKPESMEDEVPRTIEGAVLSIADKADSIAGMFALGLIPSGSKDPFALRRQANGIIRTIAEKQFSVSLRGLFQDAVTAFEQSDIKERLKCFKVEYVGSPNEKLVPVAYTSNPSAFREAFEDAILSFLLERITFYLKDHKGYAYDVVKAVLSSNADDVVDAEKRASAVTAVRETSDFNLIATAFKRLKNIVRQAQSLGVKELPKFDQSLFTNVEHDLYREMQPIGRAFVEAQKRRDYSSALKEVVKLAPFIDAFFDKVLIMAEDDQLRGNRLRFVNQIGRDFSGIADFSEIVTEKK